MIFIKKLYNFIIQYIYQWIQENQEVTLCINLLWISLLGLEDL